MTALVKLQQETVTKAWENWLEFHYGLHCEEVMDRFFKLIDPGDRYGLDPWDHDVETYKVAPDVAHRVRAAAGSHYHAIFKANYIKNPWK